MFQIWVAITEATHLHFFLFSFIFLQVMEYRISCKPASNLRCILSTLLSFI